MLNENNAELLARSIKGMRLVMILCARIMIIARLACAGGMQQGGWWGCSRVLGPKKGFFLFVGIFRIQ